MQYYIIVLILALAIISILLNKSHKLSKQKRISTLAALSFFLVLAGIFFGENPWVGYSLIGSGVVLALVDIIKRLK